MAAGYRTSDTRQSASADGTAFATNTTLDYTGVGTNRLQIAALDASGGQPLNGYIENIAFIDDPGALGRCRADERLHGARMIDHLFLTADFAWTPPDVEPDMPEPALWTVGDRLVLPVRVWRTTQTITIDSPGGPMSMTAPAFLPGRWLRIRTAMPDAALRAMPGFIGIVDGDSLIDPVDPADAGLKVFGTFS